MVLYMNYSRAESDFNAGSETSISRSLCAKLKWNFRHFTMYRLFSKVVFKASMDTSYWGNLVFLWMHLWVDSSWLAGSQRKKLDNCSHIIVVCEGIHKILKTKNLPAHYTLLEEPVYLNHILWCSCETVILVLKGIKLAICFIKAEAKSSKDTKMNWHVLKIILCLPVDTGNQANGDTMEHLLVERTHAHQGHLGHLVPKNENCPLKQKIKLLFTFKFLALIFVWQLIGPREIPAECVGGSWLPCCFHHITAHYPSPLLRVWATLIYGWLWHGA